MSFFSGIGERVKGLLGSETFLDRLEQAQAFSRGDHFRAARIAGRIRARDGKQKQQGDQAAMEDVPLDPLARSWDEPETDGFYQGNDFWGRDRTGHYVRRRLR